MGCVVCHCNACLQLTQMLSWRIAGGDDHVATEEATCRHLGECLCDPLEVEGAH
jgi:hypothetical protein